MPLYGSQLWDYINRHTDSFFIAWRKALRKLFNLPYNTHCNLLPYICQDLPPNIQLYRRAISFVKGLSVSNNSITYMCYRLVMLGSCSAVSNTISVISSEWSTPRMSDPNITQDTRPFVVDANIASRCDLICDLLKTLQENKYCSDTTFLNNEEINIMLNVLCTE